MHLSRLALVAVALTGCARITYSDMEVSRGVYRISVRGNRWADPGKMEDSFHARAREICSEQGFASYDWSASTRELGRYVVAPMGGGAMVSEVQPRRGAIEGNVTCARRRPETWRQSPVVASDVAPRALDTTTGQVLDVAPSAGALFAASKRYVQVVDGYVAVTDDTGKAGYVRAADWAQAREAGYVFAPWPTGPTAAVSARTVAR